MEVEQFTMEKEKAKEQWLAYLQAHREKKEQVYRDLASVYGHMKQGRAVLDVPHSIQEGGLLDGGWPRLAIVRADYKEVYFYRRDTGRGYFSGKKEGWGRKAGTKAMGSRIEDVALASNTFRSWTQDESHWESSIGRTMAPLVPAKFIPKGDYRNYFILWEVEQWVPVGPAKPKTRPPRDPFLLKRISPTMFGVLASWDLTKLERTVLSGRIA